MYRRIALALSTLVLACSLVSAQERHETRQIMNAGPAAANARGSKPAANAEQQKYGMELLKIAEADAGGLEGGMRAWALWQVSRGYERTDKAKALQLLESALAASRSIDDDGRISTRTRLQEQILRSMVPLAPERVDDLLTQVDPAAREQVLMALLAYYEKSKQMDHALEVVYRIGAEKEIPYAAADRIMERMTPEQSGELLQLFTTALASFRDHADSHGDMFGSGGFDDMVIKFWRRLPKDVVRQAIDEMLKQAESVKQKGKGNSAFSMSSANGTVSFGSQYEYRLFQLLPVLREIDSSAAEQYLKKYREVATMLDKYPNGTNSIAPENEKGKEPHAGNGVSFGVSTTADRLPAMMAEMHRAQKLVADAEAGHVQDALANAPGISDPKLRASCYEGIARITFKKQASTARTAIDKMLDSAEKIEPGEQVNYLRAATDIYMQMDDTDSAKQMIEKGIAVADKAYAADAKADDPNKALKAFWPATEAYRSLLRQAGKISPIWALTLMKEISDPEVKVAAEAALASGWLNIPSGPTLVVTSKKGTTMMQMSREDE